MARDILMPKMGYDMTEGKLLRWLKREGDVVSRGEPLAEIETDKVTIEVEAADSGVLRRIVASEGERLPVGARIGVLTAQDEYLPEVDNSTDGPGSNLQEPAGDISGSRPLAADHRPSQPLHPARMDESRQVVITPLARQLARQHGVDLATVTGTGPGGRITREDVLAAAGRADVQSAPGVAPVPAPVPPAGTAEAQRPGEERTKELALTRLQQTVGRRMVQSKLQAPHFYLTSQVDMTDALALRQRLNARAGQETTVSINDMVIKATAQALSRFPVLNASFAEDKLLLHEEIAISVAVATTEGLITPVVRRADEKTLEQIAHETKRLAERVREGRGRPEDFEAGSFTVSNLGMFDIDTFVAIINPPQAAILAVGAIRRVPTYVEDDLVPRDYMHITLSVDHRVTDGATGARFLSVVREHLEHPDRLLDAPPAASNGDAAR